MQSMFLRWCIALHFQLLQFVHLTHCWSITVFTKQRWFAWWNGPNNAINKKRKENMKSIVWNLKCIVRWKDVEDGKYSTLYKKNTCAFKIWFWKKQHMYCFLPFGFKSVVIFAINDLLSSAKLLSLFLLFSYLLLMPWTFLNKLTINWLTLGSF